MTHSARGPAILLLTALFAVPTVALTSPPAPKDALRLVSIVPAGSVSAGSEVTFTLEVDVTLETADEAWLHLGFNDGDQPDRFRMSSQFLVRRGMERVTLTATAVPKDWGRTGEFAALLNFGPRELYKSYSPSVSLRHPISVVP